MPSITGSSCGYNITRDFSCDALNISCVPKACLSAMNSPTNTKSVALDCFETLTKGLYQFANSSKQTISSWNATLTDAWETNSPYIENMTSNFWSSFKSMAKPVVDFNDTNSSAWAVANYIENNPLNSVGACIGSYYAGKGLCNLFNSNVSKMDALCQMTAGALFTVSCLSNLDTQEPPNYRVATPQVMQITSLALLILSIMSDKIEAALKADSLEEGENFEEVVVVDTANPQGEQITSGNEEPKQPSTSEQVDVEATSASSQGANQVQPLDTQEQPALAAFKETQPPTVTTPLDQMDQTKTGQATGSGKFVPILPKS